MKKTEKVIDESVSLLIVSLLVASHCEAENLVFEN